jgi:hypothetical protein
MIVQSSFHPSPTEYLIVSDPSDVSTPRPGNITTFFNGAVDGHPLSIKTPDGLVQSIHNARQARGVIPSDTVSIIALLATNLVDARGLYLVTCNTTYDTFTFVAGDVYEKIEGTGNSSLVKRFDIESAPQIFEVVQNDTIRTGSLSALKMQEGTYVKNRASKEKWLLAGTGSLQVVGLIRTTGDVDILLTNFSYLYGLWAVISPTFTHNGTIFTLGEIREKKSGTGISSFPIRYSFAQAPNTIDLRPPLQLVQNRPELGGAVGVYAKCVNGYLYAGSQINRCVGLIATNNDLFLLLAGTGINYAGFWIVNGGCTQGSLTFYSGEIVYKRNRSYGGPDTVSRAYLFDETPASLFLRYTDGFKNNIPSGYTLSPEGTYGKKVTTSPAVNSYILMGTGSGGSSCSGMAYESFVVSEATGIAEGQLVRLHKDDEDNISIKSLVEVVDGAGSGILEVGKPNNYSARVIDPYFYSIVPIDNALLSITNSSTRTDVEVAVGRLDNINVIWGEIAKKANYSGLMPVGNTFTGIRWDATRVVVAARAAAGAYLGLLCVELLNDQQVKRIGRWFAGTIHVERLVIAKRVFGGNFAVLMFWNSFAGRYEIGYLNYNPDSNIDSATYSDINWSSYGYYSQPTIASIGRSAVTGRAFWVGSFFPGEQTIMFFRIHQSSEASPPASGALRPMNTNYQTALDYYIQILPYQKYLTNKTEFKFKVVYAALYFSLCYIEGSYGDSGSLEYVGQSVFSSAIPKPDLGTPDCFTTNCPSHTDDAVIYTFTGKYAAPGGGYHLRMYVVSIATATGVVTSIPQGGYDYYEVLNSAKCSLDTRLSYVLSMSEPIEGNGFCYIPFYDSVAGNKQGLIIVKMDGATVVHVSQFYGIAQEAGAEGAEIPVAIKGQVSTKAPQDLIKNANYYLTPAGELTTLYNQNPVGKALDTRKINLVSDLYSAPPTSTGYPAMITNNAGTNKVAADYYGNVGVIAGGAVKATFGANSIEYLPITNPGIAGAKWNDNGTIKISAGA